MHWFFWTDDYRGLIKFDVLTIAGKEILVFINPTIAFDVVALVFVTKNSPTVILQVNKTNVHLHFLHCYFFHIPFWRRFFLDFCRSTFIL